MSELEIEILVATLTLRRSKSICKVQQGANASRPLTNSMDDKKSETSLLIGYCSRQSGFPMRVGYSSVGGGAWQFHTTRWTLMMASARDQSRMGRAVLSVLCQIYCDSSEEAAKAIGVGTVKTLIHRLRNQYLTAVREQVARTVSDPAEIEGEDPRILCGVYVRRGPAEIVNT